MSHEPLRPRLWRTHRCRRRRAASGSFRARSAAQRLNDHNKWHQPWRRREPRPPREMIGRAVGPGRFIGPWENSRRGCHKGEIGAEAVGLRAAVREVSAAPSRRRRLLPPAARGTPGGGGPRRASSLLPVAPERARRRQVGWHPALRLRCAGAALLPSLLRSPWSAAVKGSTCPPGAGVVRPPWGAGAAADSGGQLLPLLCLREPRSPAPPWGLRARTGAAVPPALSPPHAVGLRGVGLSGRSGEQTVNERVAEDPEMLPDAGVLEQTRFPARPRC